MDHTHQEDPYFTREWFVPPPTSPDSHRAPFAHPHAAAAVLPEDPPPTVDSAPSQGARRRKARADGHLARADPSRVAGIATPIHPPT